MRLHPCMALSMASLLAAFAGLNFSTVPAQAKNKMTYEQAWAKCKEEVTKKVAADDSRTTAARYSAGGACMKKYGYRLKKGTQL